MIPLSGRHSKDRKSTRLNSSHTEIYTLSLHDALPICRRYVAAPSLSEQFRGLGECCRHITSDDSPERKAQQRSEEHTSELQSHRDLHSFPTRRSSDLSKICGGAVAKRTIPRLR